MCLCVHGWITFIHCQEYIYYLLASSSVPFSFPQLQPETRASHKNSNQYNIHNVGMKELTR